MGKRKSREGIRGNVVAFRSKAERAAQQAEPQVDSLSTAGACVIEFPFERIQSRGRPIFNLPVREASSGQRSLDFDGLDRPKTSCEVVQLRPVDSAHQAYNLYIRASQLDEDPATYDEAAALYEKALWLDSSLAIAEVNLGNLHFRRGDGQRAEELYRHAIGIQYRIPEGHYNLGYVMLERGDARAAAEHFKIAIEQDPCFADAHFNLAMAYEQMGKRAIAKNHWHAYLDIVPNGTWADIARKHIS